MSLLRMMTTNVLERVVMGKDVGLQCGQGITPLSSATMDKQHLSRQHESDVPTYNRYGYERILFSERYRIVS